MIPATTTPFTQFFFRMICKFCIGVRWFVFIVRFFLLVYVFVSRSTSICWPYIKWNKSHFNAGVGSQSLIDSQIWTRASVPLDIFIKTHSSYIANGLQQMAKTWILSQHAGYFLENCSSYFCTGKKLFTLFNIIFWENCFCPAVEFWSLISILAASTFLKLRLKELFSTTKVFVFI